MCLAGRADGLFMEASDRRECRSDSSWGTNILLHRLRETERVSCVTVCSILFHSFLIHLSISSPDLRDCTSIRICLSVSLRYEVIAQSSSRSLMQIMTFMQRLLHKSPEKSLRGRGTRNFFVVKKFFRSRCNPVLLIFI